MKKLALILIYSLIPILTISIEDVYFLDKFSTGMQNPQYWLFSKALILPPIVILMLIGIGIAIVLRPTRVNRLILLIAIVFFVALMTGILVGIYGKIEAPKLLFEFQYWRSLVFFILLTYLISKVMTIDEFDKFIDWFVLIQFLYSAYVLVIYFFFRHGQFSYVGQLVPIFAGDQLSFILFACFILSARIVVKPSLYSIIAELVMILVLFLSLRRTPMAAAAASLVLAIVLLLIRNGKGKRLLVIFSLGAAVALILGFVLWTTQQAAIESSFIFQRFKSINPFWADQQTDVFLTSMGHTDDFLDGFDLVQQSPILGKGLNTDFVLLRTGNWQKDDLHSAMFSLWVKMGLPGLIFYLLVVTYGMRFFFKGLKNHNLKAVWLVIFVIAFSFFNFMTTVYTNGVFLGYKSATCMAIYMAGCFFLSKEISSKNDPISLSVPR